MNHAGLDSRKITCDSINKNNDHYEHCRNIAFNSSTGNEYDDFDNGKLGVVFTWHNLMYHNFRF